MYTLLLPLQSSGANSFPQHPVGLHLGLALHLQLAAALETEAGPGEERGPRGLAAVDPPRQPAALHPAAQQCSAVQCSILLDRPAGGVDRVPEETVARHPGAHHAGAAGPGVKPDPDPQPLLRLVSALSQSPLSLLFLQISLLGSEPA